MLTCDKGSDTSRVAITSTLFYCLHNPDILHTPNAEILAAFAVVEEIRLGPQLDSCHYLRAFINESMRLSPPLGGIMPRQALHGGIEIDGHFFPEGIEIGTPIYVLHRQECHFADPHVFRPARWLSTTTEGKSSVSSSHPAFCPFSIGPRSCAGKVLAYAEVSIVLARILFLFDMRLWEHAEPRRGKTAGVIQSYGNCEFHTFDSIVALHDGPLVEFRRRC